MADEPVPLLYHPKIKQPFQPVNHESARIWCEHRGWQKATKAQAEHAAAPSSEES